MSRRLLRPGPSSNLVTFCVTVRVPVSFGGLQGNLIVSVGTSYFGDMVTANNGVTVAGGDLAMSVGDLILSDG